MPQNKKHHYVPRFYLKRFSSDGKSINIWNLHDRRKICSANLKHQCYKDYFYGKEPEIEATLGYIEGKTAEVLRLIDIAETSPPPDSPDYLLLALYVLTQYGRTAYSADALDELSDKMMKYLFGPQAEAEGIDLTGISIGLKEPGKYSLGLVVQNYPLILDLQCKLLINKSEVEFVTSDNPVVLYNQLFSFRKRGSNNGLASKGLQIFIPIGPRKQLVFFDPAVYGVGNINKSVVPVVKPKDVYELNTLQMCSASKNIYFNDPNMDIEALHKKASPFRRKNKSNLDVFLGHDSGERRQELIASSWEDIRTSLNLSFLRFTVSTKKWRDAFRKLQSQPAAVVRDPKMCNDHRDFMKEVKAQKYQPGDFLQFLNDKYGQS